MKRSEYLAILYYDFFYQADRCGKLLHEVMGWTGPVTYRQHLAWRAWVTMDFESPSRDNYYQMQTAMRIDSGNVKEPSKLKLDDYRLRSEKSAKKATKQLTLKEASSISKAMWAVRLGIAIPVNEEQNIEENESKE